MFLTHRSDTQLAELWRTGQERAVTFAWGLGMRPPSMAAVACVPSDLPLKLPQREMWFVQPWADEGAATKLMRSADAVDSSEPQELRTGTTGR
jgi:hypothetical protein